MKKITNLVLSAVFVIAFAFTSCESQDEGYQDIQQTIQESDPGDDDDGGLGESDPGDDDDGGLGVADPGDDEDEGI